jgi:hypothetical protein
MAVMVLLIGTRQGFAGQEFPTVANRKYHIPDDGEHSTHLAGQDTGNIMGKRDESSKSLAYPADNESGDTANAVDKSGTQAFSFAFDFADEFRIAE